VGPSSTSHEAWLSYDSVAEAYERVAVPWFTPLARDLVAAAGVSSGDHVLDIGTGTGLTAELAGEAVGPGGFVVGIDPSMRMLDLARERRGIAAVRAKVPGLPFPGASFDVVLANLVLSHLPDLVDGLSDIVRVLDPGGRLGATAWAPDSTDDDEGNEADRIVASARAACGLASEAPVKGAPWEEALRSRARLTGALGGAGLVHVEARLSTYRTVFTIDDYLVGWGGLGRYLRWHAGNDRWRSFTDQAAVTLRARFGDTIVVERQMWVATGAAPRLG
jgi:SAM-dependent methyltransferase